MLIEQQAGKVLIDGNPIDPEEAEGLAEALSDAAEKAREEAEFEFLSSYGTPFVLSTYAGYIDLNVPTGSPGFLMDRPLALRVAEAIRTLALRLPA